MTFLIDANAVKHTAAEKGEMFQRFAFGGHSNTPSFNWRQTKDETIKHDVCFVQSFRAAASGRAQRRSATRWMDT